MCMCVFSAMRDKLEDAEVQKEKIDERRYCTNPSLVTLPICWLVAVAPAHTHSCLQEARQRSAAAAAATERDAAIAERQ